MLDSATPDLYTQRRLTIEIACDASVPAGRLYNLAATETSACRYQITGRSSSACGVKDDPFDFPIVVPVVDNAPQKYSTGAVFGYVILGSVLSVFTYAIADRRGWIDPITRK